MQSIANEKKKQQTDTFKAHEKKTRKADLFSNVCEAREV